MNSPPTNSGLKKGHVSPIETGELNVPVYSASADENAIFGRLSNDTKRKIYDNMLTWNKDGSSGKVFYRTNQFIPYEKVKLLAIKSEYLGSLDYLYLKYVLELELLKRGYGFTYKCSMKRVLEVEIQVPTKKDGDFDLEAQQEIASQYILIDEFKNKIKAYQDRVTRLQVQIENNGITRGVPISEIFDSLGIPKKIQKSDLQGEGSIPTYSSQIENQGLMGHYIEAMFGCSVDNPLITFGDHTKAIYIRQESFSVVDNVKVLQLKKEYIGKINLEFILGCWHSLIPDLGYARHRKEAKKCIIHIPTSTDGSFDLIKQQEIAEIYESIAYVKSQISEKLQVLQDLQIII